jgi:hypothetical protein
MAREIRIFPSSRDGVKLESAAWIRALGSPTALGEVSEGKEKPLERN